MAEAGLSLSLSWVGLLLRDHWSGQLGQPQHGVTPISHTVNYHRASLFILQPVSSRQRTADPILRGGPLGPERTRSDLPKVR